LEAKLLKVLGYSLLIALVPVLSIRSESAVLLGDWICLSKNFFGVTMHPKGRFVPFNESPRPAIRPRIELEEFSINEIKFSHILIEGTGVVFDGIVQNPRLYHENDKKTIRRIESSYGSDSDKHLILARGDNDLWTFFMSKRKLMTDKEAREGGIKSGVPKYYQEEVGISALFGECIKER
jgi:hypothetical protein